jgi:hypothetical protein
MSPINQFDYLMARGEGNKGVSYRRTWRPDWRSPPGVSHSRVFLQLMAVLGIAALPMYFLSRCADVSDQCPSEYSGH